jgi:N-carbamoylputrescine amidase
VERKSKLTIAVAQAALGEDTETNIARVEDLLFSAAERDAELIVLPELFDGPYFCRTETEAAFDLARPVDAHPTVSRFRQLAKELELVVPVSFFERSGQQYFNSVAMIDADGELLGVYRKSHIPDGPGYQEKFYFSPGNTGFRVWNTAVGAVGVGICWDQWFPEAARAMALQGAEILVYPSTIGSEPHDPGLDTRKAWRRVMVGHAVANAIPVAAANRVGTEGELTFYGSSFVVDAQGDVVAALDDSSEGLATAELDLDEIRRFRAGFGLFRDRRPELYKPLSDLEPGSS